MPAPVTQANAVPREALFTGIDKENSRPSPAKAARVRSHLTSFGVPGVMSPSLRSPPKEAAVTSPCKSPLGCKGTRSPAARSAGRSILADVQNHHFDETKTAKGKPITQDSSPECSRAAASPPAKPVDSSQPCDTAVESEKVDARKSLDFGAGDGAALPDPAPLRTALSDSDSMDGATAPAEACQTTPKKPPVARSREQMQLERSQSEQSTPQKASSGFEALWAQSTPVKGSISDLWVERTTPCKTPSSKSQAEPTSSQIDSASCETQCTQSQAQRTPRRTATTPILKAGTSLTRKTQSESNLRSEGRRGKGKHVEVVVPEVSSSSAPNSPPASPSCAGTPDQPFRLRSPASFRVPRLSQPPPVNTPCSGPNDTPHSTPLSPKAKPFYPRRLRLNSDADAAPTDPDSVARPSSTPLSPKAKPFYPPHMRGLFSPALFSPCSLTRCASMESPAQPRAAVPPDTSTLMSPVIPLAAPPPSASPFTPSSSVELGHTDSGLAAPTFAQARAKELSKLEALWLNRTTPLKEGVKRTSPPRDILTSPDTWSAVDWWSPSNKSMRHSAIQAVPQTVAQSVETDEALSGPKKLFADSETSTEPEPVPVPVETAAMTTMTEPPAVIETETMTEAPIATPVAEVETMTEAPNPVAETETMTESPVSTSEIGTITEAEVCAVEIHQASSLNQQTRMKKLFKPVKRIPKGKRCRSFLKGVQSDPRLSMRLREVSSAPPPATVPLLEPVVPASALEVDAPELIPVAPLLPSKHRRATLDMSAASPSHTTHASPAFSTASSEESEFSPKCTGSDSEVVVQVRPVARGHRKAGRQTIRISKSGKVTIDVYQ
uniref:Uncharacterized protein n=1 Tax=Eutreptiella gymnastica TaxID=73025 RepID=A0A7S4G6T7_9EUGL